MANTGSCIAKIFHSLFKLKSTNLKASSNLHFKFNMFQHLVAKFKPFLIFFMCKFLPALWVAMVFHGSVYIHTNGYAKYKLKLILTNSQHMHLKNNILRIINYIKWTYTCEYIHAQRNCYRETFQMEIILTNNKRLHLPDYLHFAWEQLNIYISLLQYFLLKI